MRIVIGVARMKGSLSQFRGCLVGALLGDCLGEPYESEFVDLIEYGTLRRMVNLFFDKLPSTSRKESLRYTDDTAMTWDIAESLLAHKGFQPADMAKRFCDTYYNEEDVDEEYNIRNYGANVVDVFAKWKSKLDSWSDVDPYKAASEQFGGTGSYGNGGAMRVSPVALFTLNQSYDEMIQLARQSALLTHTHRHGVNGTLLQCTALHQVLNESEVSSSQFDKNTFVDQLIERMKSFEPPAQSEAVDASIEVSQPYTYKLMLIKKYLSSDAEISNEEIVKTLGNSVTAPKSVPTAIYCFLKNVSSEPDQVGAVGRFEHTLRYAISLGGDTDTIATMAGSLAGAYYGFDAIQSHLQQACEGIKNAIRLADQLYALCSK